MTLPHRILVGITGASGARYARLLVEKLLTFGEMEISVVATDNGLSVVRHEDRDDWLDDPRLRRYADDDLFAPPASGSARFEAMVIVPCSMGTVGRLAAGISNDLLARAADVMLKERRRVIVVPRETPLHTIHLRNLTALSECGAIVCPAAPAFYMHPAGVDELCATVIDRIVDLLGFESGAGAWGVDP